jgi:hypothetical protein
VALGLVRAESSFRPRVTSPAGALGLMQLMATTAQGLWREEKHRRAASLAELLDPPVNVRLGMRYLARLLRSFDRREAYAVATYNAGPSAVLRWREAQGDLPEDIFVEEIPFAETRAYVKDKFRSALWLIKSVEQRQKTIFKVAKSIVNFQRAFLDHGIEHLRPLVLRDVANDIGMHESTVSRVVSNKYIHTPRGLFPMKYFFHSGIDSTTGNDVSSVSIKNKIARLIADEDARRPHSDARIMQRLRAEGIQIARRTVAKYREELRIPSSSQRKQAF